MFHMIGHAIFGLLIGLLARAVMPGRQHMGLILTMILGLVGAWLGGLIGRLTGMYEEGSPSGLVHGTRWSADCAVYLLTRRCLILTFQCKAELVVS